MNSALRHSEGKVLMDEVSQRLVEVANARKQTELPIGW